MPLSNNCRALRTSLSKVRAPPIWNVLLKGPIPSPSGRHDRYFRTQVSYKTIVWNVGPAHFAPARLSVAPVRQRWHSTRLFSTFVRSSTDVCNVVTRPRMQSNKSADVRFVSKLHGLEIVRRIVIELKPWNESRPFRSGTRVLLLRRRVTFRGTFQNPIFVDRIPAVPGRLTAVVVSVPVWFTSAFARLAHVVFPLLAIAAFQTRASFGDRFFFLTSAVWQTHDVTSGRLFAIRTRGGG